MKNMEWKMWVRSLRGTRHRKKGMMNQDQYFCEKRGNQISVVLVDGIGKTDITAKAGKRVSELTATFFHEMSEFIREADEYTIAYNLVRRVQRLLDQMSKEYHVEQRELSSTLLAIYLDPEEDYYVACHLGDGVIAVSEDNQKIHIVFEPQKGVRPNETILTTSDTALGNMRVRRASLGNIKTFVMATDGFYNTRDDKKALKNVFMDATKDDKMEEKMDDQTIIKLFGGI